MIKKRNPNSNVKKMFQPHISTYKSNLCVCMYIFFVVYANKHLSNFQIGFAILLYLVCIKFIDCTRFECLGSNPFQFEQLTKTSNGDGAYFKLNTEEIIQYMYLPKINGNNFVFSNYFFILDLKLEFIEQHDIKSAIFGQTFVVFLFHLD